MRTLDLMQHPVNDKFHRTQLIPLHYGKILATSSLLKN
jgi:hypothetical protein